MFFSSDTFWREIGTTLTDKRLAQQGAEN